MPLKVAFQLSDADLEYLRAMIRQSKRNHKSVDCESITAATSRLLGEMERAGVSEFVRERMDKLQNLAAMVSDSEWCLEDDDRERVLGAMAYFCEPKDMIPDTIPGLGYLDDAILIEIVCQDLRHEIEAYRDFCQYRETESKRRGADDPATRKEWLAARRIQLQERMRRRRKALWDARLGRQSLFW
jgi:uncharacterized membrane protein YkvA (DUF1232 family)